MSSHTDILELLPGYVLDCLDEEELILVSEHLAICADCRAELHAYQAVADRLALALPAAAPPPGLKRRVMAHIRPPQLRPSVWPSLTHFMQRTMPVWGVASLFLVLILAVSNVLLWRQVNRPEITTNGLGGMRAIPLSSTGITPGASGYIIISADGWDGALVVDELPPLDPERQYQLWLIRDGQRTSGAVFSVDQGGYGGTRISVPASLFEYSTVGITIEPSGGSPGPTGEKVLDGTLN